MFFRRKDKVIWLIKHPNVFKNEIEIIEENMHGWNSHPEWKNTQGENMGSPSSPWSLFVQDILSENETPLIEIVNDNISKDDDSKVIEWSLNKKKSEYVLWLIGYDIVGSDIKEENIWNFFVNIEVSEKILFLEAAYHMLNKINKGQKIERFRKLINILYNEVLNKNNKILLKVIEEYKKDWDNI